jgi:hypothetical protein
MWRSRTLDEKPLFLSFAGVVPVDGAELRNRRLATSATNRHRRLLERDNVHGRVPDAGAERRRGGRVISTLIVEDDYHVASIHAAYVRKIRGVSVAGQASTAASARSEIRRLAPILVLLDL